MPSFLINPDDINDDQIVITGKEAHHIQRVLRLDVGDTLTLFDGLEYRYEARIVQQDAKQILVEFLSKKVIFPSDVEITLVQCLPRLDKMDLIVQKAVELGVSRIVPALSQRCRSIQPSRLTDKHKRWQRIALEAAKQCGQACLPVIEEVRKLENILNGNFEDVLKIVFWEAEKSKKLKEVLRGSKCNKISLLVGPEGGFAEDEVSLMRDRNWEVIGLGNRILRLETAAIVGMGIIQYELGDLSV